MMRFILPIRLISEANRAGSEHWRKRHRRAKAQRLLAALRTAAVWNVEVRRRVGALEWIRIIGTPEAVSEPLVVTLVRIAPRALDSDNLAGCAKHVRDGIADALGIKDNDPRVEWRVEQRRGKPKEYAVEIVIESKA